jgi:hypothetical protein
VTSLLSICHLGFFLLCIVENPTSTDLNNKGHLLSHKKEGWNYADSGMADLMA